MARRHADEKQAIHKKHVDDIKCNQMVSTTVDGSKACMTEEEYQLIRRHCITTHKVTAESQQLNEKMLPHIMRHVLSGVQHMCQDWTTDLSSLTNCIFRNLNGAEYVMRYPGFFMELVHRLNEMMLLNKHSRDSFTKVDFISDGDYDTRVRYGSEDLCIQMTVRCLTMFMAATHKSPETKAFWEKVLTRFDLVEMMRRLSATNPNKENANDLHLENIFDFVCYMRVVHGIYKDLPTRLQMEWDNADKDDYNKEKLQEIKARCPAEHMQHFMRKIVALDAVYTEFCSAPNCGAPDPMCVAPDFHRSYKRCSRCKLSKYCSKKCQSHHWSKGGHKNECDAEPICISFKTPTQTTMPMRQLPLTRPLTKHIDEVD